MSEISAAEHPHRFVTVLGKRMAYVDLGDSAAPAVLFLHGNPTSSYLWRNIMPYVTDRARAVAPDLIGMGASDKLDDPGPDSYRFVEHVRYLDAFIDAVLPTGKLVLVVHDWGSALGFHWAHRHPDRVRGIAYMEALVQPIGWADWPKASKMAFQAMRSNAGEEMVLEKNFFVERILPASILRPLSEAEMEVYRRPYVFAGEDRRPTLTWPRQLPIEGEPADVAEIVAGYGRWLSTADVPKLFINADPGVLLVGKPRSFCRGFPNQTEITVEGIHFIQEDSPHEIGHALALWIKDLP
ncbi:MAG: haloalkane dehalogenase [Alphaproteobacteria bacterium]|nr:MAG: haloalkane dehalogenase [Alphaproteobacteria bacterium]